MFPTTDIILKQTELSKIEYNVQGNKKRETILDSLNSLKEENKSLNIEYLTQDYIHSKKRKQTIYYVYTKPMIDYLSNKN